MVTLPNYLPQQKKTSLCFSWIATAVFNKGKHNYSNLVVLWFGGYLGMCMYTGETF